MDGWQFSKEIRARLDGAWPVVVVTALPDASAAAKQIGAQAFLRKPLEMDDLLKAVANHIAPAHH